MNYQDLIKKALVLIIIVIAISIGAMLIMTMFKKEEVAPAQETQEIKSPVKKTEVPTEKLPDKFPVGLPIEENAVISQNYNAKATDGRFQATRAFETKETLASNLALYTNYLKSNGWSISSTVDQPSYKMVAGSKAKQQLQISISENSATKAKTVSISLTETP